MNWIIVLKMLYEVIIINQTCVSELFEEFIKNEWEETFVEKEQA